MGGRGPPMSVRVGSAGQREPDDDGHIRQTRKPVVCRFADDCTDFARAAAACVPLQPAVGLDCFCNRFAGGRLPALALAHKTLRAGEQRSKVWELLFVAAEAVRLEQAV